MKNRQDKQKQKIMLWVIAGGFVLLAVKFYAFLMTGSNAVWSDALEALANVGSGTVVFFALRYAATPPDKEHPFGHGKIEFFTVGLEGAFVLSAGIASMYKGIYSFFEPPLLREFTLGIVLTVIAGAGNALMGRYLIVKGREMHSLSLEGDGKHLLSDTLSSVGLAAGLLITYWTKIYWTDSLLAIIFGIIIVKIGLELLKKAFDGLMDTASLELLEDISEKIRHQHDERWTAMHGLKILKSGNAFFVSYHLVLPWYFSVLDCVEAVEKMNELMAEITGENTEFSEHIEACEEKHCASCALACAHRKQIYQKIYAWDVENITGTG
jgi:cation diffusion facilitator family transporter